MRYVARAGGGKSPKSATAGRVYNLWIGGKSWFAAARDRYLDSAASWGGQVVVLEYFGTAVGAYLSMSGIEVISVCEAPLGEGGGAAGQKVVPEKWRNFFEGKSLGLVMAPLWGIESVWRSEDRRALFGSIYANLSPGGRFLFDARYWGTHPENALNGLSRLALDERGADGASLLVWETWRKAGSGAGAVELALAAETVCPDGVVSKKRYARLLRAALDPALLGEELRDAGFEVESVEGGFMRERLAEGAEVQFWVAKKPRGEDAR